MSFPFIPRWGIVSFYFIIIHHNSNDKMTAFQLLKKRKSKRALFLNSKENSMCLSSFFFFWEFITLCISYTYMILFMKSLTKLNYYVQRNPQIYITQKLNAYIWQELSFKDRLQIFVKIYFDIHIRKFLTRKLLSNNQYFFYILSLQKNKDNNNPFMRAGHKTWKREITTYTLKQDMYIKSILSPSWYI